VSHILTRFGNIPTKFHHVGGMHDTRANRSRENANANIHIWLQPIITRSR
jgi:hypothetical protein